MPYKIDPKNKKCVVKADTGTKVGCTKGSVKDIKESEEPEGSLNQINHEDLYTGLNVVVNGVDSISEDVKWVDEIGTVIYDYNGDTGEDSNSFLIAFDKWDGGHNGNADPACDKNKCWSFYNDCQQNEYGDCSNIDKITFQTIDSYSLFDKLNESEEWYDDILNENPLIRFDDLKVGDIISLFKTNTFSNLNSEFNNLIQDDIYYHIDSFKEATTHRNGYAEKETVAVCSLMKENPDTGNYYGISRETIDLVRGNNKPVWTLIYREGVMESINESEWFEDVVNEPIMLKVEELEMGDIVIPTCAYFGEYIVMAKGTSVKLLDAPTHWVTLKRNTKANTGGVFIEHDTETGKNCRFKLIHRENIIEESEEFDWVGDIIDEGVNIGDFYKINLEYPIVAKVEDIIFDDNKVTSGNSGYVVKVRYFNDNEEEEWGDQEEINLDWMYNLTNPDENGPSHWVKVTKEYAENMFKDYAYFKSPMGWVKKYGKNINESEDDFEWAEDIIANTTEEIDISNNFDLWENKLVEGSVVKITGRWEDMYFEDDVATIVNSPDEAGSHLLKFDRIIYEFGNEDEGNHTHCGENETENIKCECQRRQRNRDEVGKCWWTNLRYMEKIIYLPFEGKQITESEEDSELFWAEDLLDFNNPINITDKLDVMEELPVGSILQVQGYQDGMEFDMEEVKLINKAEDKDFQSTYYLFKLKYERGTGNEMSHCGNGQKNRKICECRDENENDEISQSEIGKCWWIELKKQDKVIYYPNRIDLSENKIKKPLLTEGRYDAITRKVVRDIMKAVTEGDSDSYNLPWDISTEQEYEQEGLSFSLELDIVRTNDVEIFEVRTAVADEDDENIIMMTIILGPRFNQQKLEKLFYKLQEDVIHEIEHFTQMGPNRIEDRPIYKGSTANLKTVYGHHKNIIEVPALVRGFYRRAKLEKRPLDEIMIEDLDSEIERGGLTKKQAENLLTVWIHYAKKNLPHAIYRNK
jgi:hypothetical protein